MITKINEFKNTKVLVIGDIMMEKLKRSLRGNIEWKS